MQNPLLEQRVAELVATEGVMLVMDSAGAVSEMHLRGGGPAVRQGLATIEAAGWHVHMNFGAVEGVQFVEADDRVHGGIAKLYYVRFSGANQDTSIRFYFPNPWLDDSEKPTELRPERLKAFEHFRDRYVGENDIELVRRPGQPCRGPVRSRLVAARG